MGGRQLKQLVSDIKFFFNDNLDTSKSPETSLIHRAIINNPKAHQSGHTVIDSENFTSFDLGAFNYIFITGDKRFTILLDERIALYTSQFSYINPRGKLTAKIFPHIRGETNIKYLFGSFALGDVESATASGDSHDPLNFDVAIDSLIYDTQPCENPMTASVMSEMTDLCDLDFTWDEALQQLILDD